MLLSRSGQHVLRALVHLAEREEREGGQPVRAAEIAEALEVPANYLSKLLNRLARAGLVSSARGPRGGFMLLRAADELTLLEALAPVEADWEKQRCLLGRAECTDADPCPAHGEWKGVREQIQQFLSETVIADLVRPAAGT